MASRDERARLVWSTVDRLSRLPLWAVLVVAVAARLAAGLAFSAGGTDTYEFGQIAENVVDGNGYAYFPADDEGPLPAEQIEDGTRWLPSAYMPPLYTYTVVAAREVSGDSTTSLVWAVRGINLVLSCAGVAAVYALTRRLIADRRAATLAALGFALYPPLVYGATQVSAANLYVPLETAALLALLAAARTPSVRSCMAVTAVMGLLCLVRAEAVLLLPVVALWLWWASGREDFGVRTGSERNGGDEAAPRHARAPTPATSPERAGLAVAFLVVAAILPAAWLVRNTATFGETSTTIATSGGANLWIGNHEGASGSQKSFDIPGEMSDEIRALPADDDFELQREAIFRREAVDYMTGDPVGTVVRDVKKAGLLLVADVYDKRSLNPAYLGGWFALAAFGTLGLIEWWRRTRDLPTRVLMAGFLAINIAIPVVFFALARYRLPIEVTMLTFAGAWLAVRAERYLTTSSPPSASTVTVAPSAMSPSSSAMASRSAT
jgi:hypothetical protein